MKPCVLFVQRKLCDVLAPLPCQCLHSCTSPSAHPRRSAGLKLALSLRSLPALALSTGAPAEAALAAADRALAAAARAGGFAGGAPELISAHRGELLRAEAEAAADAAAAGRACWAESDASRVLLIAGDAELSVRWFTCASRLCSLWGQRHGVRPMSDSSAATFSFCVCTPTRDDYPRWCCV